MIFVALTSALIAAGGIGASISGYVLTPTVALRRRFMFCAAFMTLCLAASLWAFGFWLLQT